MRRASVREYAAAVRERYQRGSKSERGRILDEFCQITGYHRVYARAMLRATPTVPGGVGGGHGRPRRYGEAEIRLVQACWEVTDGLCGKRLAPFLPELLERLRACDALPAEATPAVIARVAGMSAATGRPLPAAVSHTLAGERPRPDQARDAAQGPGAGPDLRRLG